jgi:hypothetical protein
MNTVAGVPLVFWPRVKECLDEMRLMAGFVAQCKLMRECYPSLIRFEVTLWDDYFSDKRPCLVIAAVLPNEYPRSQALEQERLFQRRLPGTAPPAVLRYFSWSFGFDGRNPFDRA